MFMMARTDNDSLIEFKSDFQPHRTCSEISETEEASINQPNDICITVSIESIENIDVCKIKEIAIRVDFAGDILCQCDKIQITARNMDINLSGFIHSEDSDVKFMNDILDNPVLFTVYDNTLNMAAAPPSPKQDKEMKNKTAKTTASRASGRRAATNQNVLGLCNLDIGQFLMGKKRIRQNLILELEKKVMGKDLVSWVKLPRLVVVASINDNSDLTTITEHNNVVSVTVQAVFNPPDNVPEGAIFDAVFPIPSFGNKNNNLIFHNGIVTSERDSDLRKKWNNLQNIDGRGGRTKHEISEFCYDIINCVPEVVDLEKEMKKHHPQIVWNTLRNCLISKSDSNNFYSKLMKYRVWPLEMVVNKTSVQKSQKSDKKSKQAANDSLPNSDHFTAFLNLTTLLYPGVTKVRTAAPLLTYSQTDLFNKFGIENPPSYSLSSVPTISKSKTVSERSKTSAKETENKKEDPGMPVVNKEGQPSFVVVEVEFWKPFTLKREPEYLKNEVKCYVSLKGKIPKKRMTFKLAQKSFKKAVKDIVSLMHDEYANFTQTQKSLEITRTDVDVAFHEYLLCQESFNKIFSCLEEKILAYIHEKYGDLTQYNEKIPDIYVELTEEMYKITNTYVEGISDSKGNYFNSDNLQFFAEEAIEEQDFDSAKKYLLLSISKNKNHPDYWLDYAVFCIKMNDLDTAVEAIREALTLDINHQMGLLLYGLIMAKLKEAAISEITFQFLTTKYPHFIEGWKAFHLVYVIFQNFVGSDIASQMSIKLEKQKTKEEMRSEKVKTEKFHSKHFVPSEHCTFSGQGRYGLVTFAEGFSWSEPLSWTTSLCPPNNTNIRTTVLMLKLGFFELGLMTLNEDLVSQNSISCPYYRYYLSVEYYLQGRYNEAISQLELAVQDYGKDFAFWSLMGHCYYRLEDHANAIACYEYVMELFNRPNDIHMIYLRMGYYYLQTDKFQCAKKVFVTACKYSPSPRLWKGVGIATLRLCEYEEAEVAFCEANYLDNNDAETWGYLALTNGLSGKLDMLEHCFLEARKRNLKNESLLEEIESLINLNAIELIH